MSANTSSALEVSKEYAKASNQLNAWSTTLDETDEVK